MVTQAANCDSQVSNWTESKHKTSRMMIIPRKHSINSLSCQPYFSEKF